MFLFINYYVLSPFPGWLIDYEYLQAGRFFDYLYELTKPEWGAYPYPDLQDDIFSLMLFLTGLVATLAIMVIIEKWTGYAMRKIQPVGNGR